MSNCRSFPKTFFELSVSIQSECSAKLRVQGIIDASMVNFFSLFIFIMKTPMNNFGVQNFIHPEIILSRLAACKGLHFTSIQASLLISRSHPLEILDSLSLYLQWNLIVSLLLICQQMFTYSRM